MMSRSCSCALRWTLHHVRERAFELHTNGYSVGGACGYCAVYCRALQSEIAWRSAVMFTVTFVQTGKGCKGDSHTRLKRERPMAQLFCE